MQTLQFPVTVCLEKYVPDSQINILHNHPPSDAPSLSSAWLWCGRNLELKHSSLWLFCYVRTTSWVQRCAENVQDAGVLYPNLPLITPWKTMKYGDKWYASCHTPPCWLGKTEQGQAGIMCTLWKKKKKVAGKQTGGGGRRRSVVTLTPPLDKDLFHIHSNPETMTYQSLKSL